MGPRVRSTGVLCLLAFLSASAAAQDVVPRGEPFAIAAQPGADAPGGRPGIASDGSSFLTVWRDTRNATTHADDPYAARVSRDGVVLDPAGIRLSTSTADAEWPSVAFDGTHYLVVWTAPVGSSHYEIFGTIVAADGTVVASDVPITTAAYSLNRVVSLAFDGTNFLIAWRTWSGSHIRATRVSRTGGILTSLDGAGGFVIASAGGDFYPWVTFGSGQFLVAWHGWGPTGLDIFAARVSTSGVVLDPEGFIVNASSSVKDHVSVAASGSNYLITYRDQATEDVYRNSRGYAVRVSPAGTVLDTSPILIAEDVSWGGMLPVVFDGTNYVAMYQVTVSHNARYMDIMGRRFSPTGIPLDSTPFPIGASFQTQGWLPMFGYGGGRFLAAWQDMGRAQICPGVCVGGQILETIPTAASPGVPASPIDTAAEPPADTGWQAVTSPINVAIHSVVALDDSTAFAGTENTHQLRYDGSSWSSWNGSFVGTDFALWANAPHDVAAAGWSFGVKRFDGTQWIWTNLDAQRGLAQLAQGLWSSGHDAFLVGTQGRAIRYDGTSWSADATGTGLDLWDVWGSAPDDVFAVGERGTLLHWNGTAWARVSDVPTRQNLNAIWGTSATNVFAVGDFGTILHFDGAAWTLQASGTTRHLTGIAGLSPTAIFAVGFGGTILRYNGVSWQSEASATTSNLLDVAVGGHTVWAVGDYGTIRRNVIDAAHCTRSLDRTALSVPAGGGVHTVILTTNCVWRAWTGTSWMALTSASSGTGSTTASFTVHPNTGTSPRVGTLTIGSVTVTVTQAGAATGCTFTLNPTSANHGFGQSGGTVGVTSSDASCAWTAVSNASWLAITSGAPGTGNGTVGYSVLANPTSTSRNGTLTMAGQTFTVTQAGTTPGCTFALAPTSASHGAGATGGSVVVTASSASCAWTAGSNASWLAITSGAPGTGNGTVGYSLLANPTSTSRNGTLTIAGQTFTVTQAGSLPTLQPPVNLVAAVAGSTVTTTWSIPAGGLTPTAFVLEGGIDPGQVLASLPIPVAAQPFVFTAPTGVFFIRVHALAGTTRSAASNEVRIAVNVPMRPAAPVSLVGEAFGSHLRLSWANRLNEGTPTALFLDVSGAVSASLPLPVAETFAFSGVPAGTYTLALRAVNDSGTSTPSNTVTLTFPTACVPAATPAGLVATRSGNVVSVTWSRGAGGPTPTGYVVRVTGAASLSIPIAQTSISGAAGPGSYTISVTATHPCGESPATAPQTVVIP